MYAVDGGRRLPERELDHLAGYAGSPAGPDRQRRGRPAPDRRARRGDDRPRGRARRGLRGDAAELGPAARPGRRAGDPLGPSRTTGCGRSAARCGTSPTRGSWCGSPSTAPCGRSRSTGSTGRSSGGGRCATRCTPRCSSTGYDADAGHLHPALRHHRGRREPADAPAGRLPRPATTRACSAPSRPIEEDLMHDGLLLRYRTGPGVDGLARRRAPVPGLLVLAGLGVRRGRSARRRPRADGPAVRRWPTTSACSRRSTTPTGSGWPATSRRRSATWRWCRRRPRPALIGAHLPAGNQRVTSRVVRPPGSRCRSRFPSPRGCRCWAWPMATRRRTSRGRRTPRRRCRWGCAR